MYFWCLRCGNSVLPMSSEKHYSVAGVFSEVFLFFIAGVFNEVFAAGIFREVFLY